MPTLAPSKNHSYVMEPEPPIVIAVKVLADPSSKTANSGETATVGGAFTHTDTALDEAVLGLLALSVVLSTKLHLPTSVKLDVAKV